MCFGYKVVEKGRKVLIWQPVLRQLQPFRLVCIMAAGMFLAIKGKRCVTLTEPRSKQRGAGHGEVKLLG